MNTYTYDLYSISGAHAPTRSVANAASIYIYRRWPRKAVPHVAGRDQLCGKQLICIH